MRMRYKIGGETEVFNFFFQQYWLSKKPVNMRLFAAQKPLNCLYCLCVSWKQQYLRWSMEISTGVEVVTFSPVEV
jgi:hypothetical protein